MVRNYAPAVSNVAAIASGTTKKSSLSCDENDNINPFLSPKPTPLLPSLVSSVNPNSLPNKR